MLDSRDIVSAVERHWNTATGNLVPTIPPGGRIDLAGKSPWFELWVETFDDPPRRRVGPDRRQVSLLVHCFARHASEKRTGHDLADLARETLQGASVAILDRSQPTPHVVGHLTIYETALRDLSRNQAAFGQERLQHLVLIAQAVAHELSSP